MSTSKNKTNIRRHVDEIWNKGNLDIIPELIAPNYVVHSLTGNDAKGVEGFRQMVISQRTGVPDLHFTIDSMVAEGDMVAVCYTYKGTFTGEVQGIKPTGKKGSSKTAIFHRFENGKQAEAWTFSDTLAMYRAFGIPLPKE